MSKENNNKFKLIKDCNNLFAFTKENYGGYDWYIMTLKRSNEYINCKAWAGKFIIYNGVERFTCKGLTAPTIILSTFEGIATEQNIKETHRKGFIEFDRLKKANELPLKEGCKSNTEINS